MDKDKLNPKEPKPDKEAIALIPSRGKGSWKKFGDHSALIYYYHVLPLYRNDSKLPIGKKLKPKVDELGGIIHLRKVYAKNFTPHPHPL